MSLVCCRNLNRSAKVLSKFPWIPMGSFHETRVQSPKCLRLTLSIESLTLGGQPQMSSLEGPWKHPPTHPPTCLLISFTCRLLPTPDFPTDSSYLHLLTPILITRDEPLPLLLAEAHIDREIRLERRVQRFSSSLCYQELYVGD